MSKIIVSGACGYIGSHTLVDLIQNGFEVISIDNFSRSDKRILKGVQEITNQQIVNYNINICNQNSLYALFDKYNDIEGIIHFAAYKSVPESVQEPLMYYENNLTTLNNLLQCVKKYHIPNFVFSSSCSVYGNAQQQPVTEQTPLSKPESPYAHTKQIGEQIIENFAKISPNNQFVLLRYFNPIGAHPSGKIGELPINEPNNLVPYITQTAIGKLPQLKVFGSDYNTPDGTCLRDYIHVCDIANAHTQALKYILPKKNATINNLHLFNLGAGKGTSVLEVINAFEQVSKIKLNYILTNRRNGDVEKIYANNQKAKQLLQWQPKYNLYQMLETAWIWEQQLNELNL